MKQPVPFALRAILSIVLATFSFQVWGADCSSTDILLSSQVDVDNFQSTYGGGGVCDAVSGSLTIQDSVDITSLDGLSSLTSVGGDLEIYDNDALANLNGLSSLTSVGGNLSIQFNRWLTNLDGLSSLTSVGGDFWITSNNPPNLDGLSSLTSVAGDLIIGENDALTNLDGLSSLTSVGKSLWIYDNIALTIIDGLSSLTSVGESLSIRNNTNLTNLNGLSSLTSIGGGLTIRGSLLTNLDGLSNITSMGGQLHISHNDVLTNLDGLASLTSVGWGVKISYNTNLTNLDGLSNITSAGGSLEIYRNDALTNIDGLSNITSVGGEGLKIGGNTNLTNLDGLSSLTSVGGYLWISENASLTNLDGLSNITSVDWHLDIYDNDALTNLDGLSSITSVGEVADILYGYGGLHITHNNVLTNIDGLSNLTSVSGSLRIQENASLTNLDGLSSLTSVGEVCIDICDYGDLRITSNPVLSRCTGLTLLLGWPVGPPDDHVGSGILLSNNELGCNSVQEIFDSASGLTAPHVTASVVSSGQVTLIFTPAISPDISWPITSYQAQCLSGDQSVFANNTITDIPDESSVVSPLAVSGVATNNAAGLSIPVNITHPDNSQLSLTLMSPNGTAVKLWDGAVGDSADLVGTFPLTLTPAESLDILDGEDFNGEWQLTVADGLATQMGTLNSWGITVQDKIIATSETSPVTITGLANNQIYSCSVSAVTGQGIGPASNTVSANFTIDPFTIGGHVSGLSGTGLVLKNNFDDDLEVSADGSFTFATALYDGSAYSVTVLTQPTGSDKTCSITNSNGTVSGTDVVDVTVTCFKTNNELRNIATRAEVRTGNEILIGGFVIVGDTQKCVIVQGLGQSVAVPVGVTRLADPVLQLKSGLTTIAQNDNWQVQDNPTDVQAIEDSGRAPDDVLEATIYKCLDPGAYTALVRDYQNSTGVGMVAIYDADNGTAYLKNIATRSWVGTDHAISIAGFVVTGDTPKQILVRGLGPSMESKFPPNSPLLWDPQLKLYQGATLIETNDDWGDAANAVEIGALPEPLPPTDAKEPAILITLEPGLYTAHLLGVDGTTGIGNVAVYDLTGRQ